jgi:transketolase
MDVSDPRELALRIRLRAVRMVARQGFGYLGQALSSAEQVAAVFASARPAFEAIGTERSPVVDYTCGSLGQGLSAAAGFALAGRFRGSDARIFTMISDGELEEGQVWEAAMFAAHHRLDRLVVLLDANNSQVDGPVDSITTLEPIAAKWSAFGWRVFDLDGHDVSAVCAALAAGWCGRWSAERAGVPDVDPARAGLPASRRRWALHQAAAPRW